MMKGSKLFILWLLFITACNQNDKPKDIIEQQKMINIIADLHVMDGYMSTLMYLDTFRVAGKNYYTAIYKNHNTTQVLYDKSLKYYSMNPVLLDSMYSQVEKVLQRKEKRLLKIQDKNMKKTQTLK